MKKAQERDSVGGPKGCSIGAEITKPNMGPISK